MSALTVGGTSSVTSGANMKSVVFYNNKGGVGKTIYRSLCALRAAEYHGLRTVAIGLDRQDLLRWLSGGDSW